MELRLWDGEEEHEVLVRFQPGTAQLAREREPTWCIEELPGGFLQVRKRIRTQFQGGL